MDGDDTADPHYPHEPGEDKVRHSQPVPNAVVEKVVAAATIVDEDHDSDGEPPEYIQTDDSSRLPRLLNTLLFQQEGSVANYDLALS